MSNKECTACKTTKPESEFYFNTRAGCLKSICKSCEKATVMEWKRNNKDKVKDSNARYYQKINKDKVKEYSTRYYQKIKDTQHHKEYVEENRDKKNAYWREHYRANFEYYAERDVRKRVKKYGGEYKYFKRMEIYERDGWVCQVCNKKVNKNLKYPAPMCASIDHIIPLVDGGPHTKRNTQLAHLYCNKKIRNFGIKQTRLF